MVAPRFRGSNSITSDLWPRRPASSGCPLGTVSHTGVSGGQQSEADATMMDASGAHQDTSGCQQAETGLGAVASEARALPARALPEAALRSEYTLPANTDPESPETYSPVRLMHRLYLVIERHCQTWKTGGPCCPVRCTQRRYIKKASTQVAPAGYLTKQSKSPKISFRPTGVSE